MRTVDPNLNHHWYDESYLRAFNFLELGDNVRIHRTVVLPTASTVRIGSNVEIGPYTVLWADVLTIGSNVKIGALCVLDGENLVIGDGTKIGHHEQIYAAEKQDEKRRKRG